MAARVAAFRGQEKSILLALEDLAAARRGPDRLRVQVEQARALLLLSDYEAAAKLFEQTAASAEEQGDTDLAFRGWIGAARAHDSQLQAQGASVDFDKAVKAAGPRPNQQQRSDIAFYGSQFQLQRGETEGALVSAYEAEQLARSPLDLFYAHSSVSNVFYQLANGCGESLLIDSRSDEPGDDGTGACRRAVTAARLWETRATTVAGANAGRCWPPVRPSPSTRRPDRRSGRRACVRPSGSSTIPHSAPPRNIPFRPPRCSPAASPPRSAQTPKRCAASRTRFCRPET